MTHLDRRDFLRVSGAGAAGCAVAGRPTGGARATGGGARATGGARAVTPPFRHGVASGDPLPGSVILWTRVTPTPESLPGSGRGPTVEVRWQVAADAAFRQVVASGRVRTGPDRDHTVKIDVKGLRAGTAYHYRFLLDEMVSGTGRTRTAPAPSARVAAGLRFGVVSCANWEAGYFGAYRHLAARDDLFGVIHLGDYIYEYGTGIATAAGRVVRVNVPAHEIVSLADYRMRHALYKTDPDLQALHARYPWMIIWDDHEVANDTWSGGAQNHDPVTEGPWSARLAASRQAYFEWMPVRMRAGGVTYRRLRFGRLAELTLLDLRGHRSQVSGTAVGDPARTMTGDAQMAWLKDGLSASKGETAWRLVGNSVMISPLAPGTLPARRLGSLNRLLGVPERGEGINADQWDGYTADRTELLGHLHDGRIDNTVFLTGDIHTSWANEVPLAADTYPASPSVATELVLPSVTSDNIDDGLRVPPRTMSVAAEALIAAANRHVRWSELDSHGYGVIDVRPERVVMDWYRLSDRTRPDASVSRMARFAVADRTQRLQEGGPAPAPGRRSRQA